MAKKVFITGTNTDIGKTFISGLILKKLNECSKNANYFKPVISGNIKIKDKLVPGDAVYVKDISKLDIDIYKSCPYIFEKAVSPHLAARIEKKILSLNKLYQKYNLFEKNYDYVLIEGAGGIICPLYIENEEIWLVDFIKKTNSPLIVVTNAELGTINSTLLTLHYIKTKKLKIKAIILNKYDKNNIIHKENYKVIKNKYNEIPLYCVKLNQKSININIEELKDLFE